MHKYPSKTIALVVKQPRKSHIGWMYLCLFTLLAGVLYSCQEPATPKPRAYFRIDTGAHQYQKHQQKNIFSFQKAQQAWVQNVEASTEKEEWFTLHYPQFDASLYCSYFSITPQQFSMAEEDSRKLLYSHTFQSTGVTRSFYSNPEQRNYGSLYRIHGQVATPLQFTLSDSCTYYLRGSLYFNQAVNIDSVAPVVAFLQEDIEVIMSSFTAEK